MTKDQREITDRENNCSLGVTATVTALEREMG